MDLLCLGARCQKLGINKKLGRSGHLKLTGISQLFVQTKHQFFLLPHRRNPRPPCHPALKQDIFLGASPARLNTWSLCGLLIVSILVLWVYVCMSSTLNSISKPRMDLGCSVADMPSLHLKHLCMSISNLTVAGMMPPLHRLIGILVNFVIILVLGNLTKDFPSFLRIARC